MLTSIESGRALMHRPPSQIPAGRSPRHLHRKARRLGKLGGRHASEQRIHPKETDVSV